MNRNNLDNLNGRKTKKTYRRDRSNIYKERRKRVKFPGRIKLLVIVVVVSFIFINWWLPQYQKIQVLQQQLADLEERKNDLKRTNEQLEKELSWLKTDAAVEKLAREELGMIKQGERPLISIQP